MWKEDSNTMLASLPTSVIRQIREGVKPIELKGLSLSVLEYIRVHQLSRMEVLLLAGLNQENAAKLIFHRKLETRENR